jgi:serine/threonine protein kinase
MLAPDDVLQNRYRVIRRLGHGGMGAVYEAIDRRVSSVVALKETFAETDEERRAFEREAKLLANLEHPAFPRVMDHFFEGEGQYLVMQLVPGNDLAELLALRESPFPYTKVLEWADQLLDALHELHSHRPPIIHRDIKPSNLKLTPKGKIILLDFGIAKGAAGQMSTVGGSVKSVYGYTRHYAPLEQITGAGTDPRSDLYSLAATLWSLLTAELPPDSLSRVSNREEGESDPLRLAGEKNPEVPAGVAAVLHQAMSLNRNQRPTSAAEMRKMLREAEEAHRKAEAEAAHRAEEERRLKEEREHAEEAERRRAADHVQRLSYQDVVTPPSASKSRRTILAAILIGLGTFALAALIWRYFVNPSASASIQPASRAEPSTQATPDELAEFEKKRQQVDQDPANMAKSLRDEAAVKGTQIPLDSTDPEFLYLYGRALMLLGDNMSAMSAFEGAIANVKPDTSPVQDRLRVDARIAMMAVALRLRQLQPGAEQKAIAAFNELINRAPTQLGGSQ